MNKYILALLPVILIGLSSYAYLGEMRRIESYDIIATDNPNYRIIENNGNKYYVYNYVHVGDIHERRFVADGQAFYFIRKFQPLSSSVELITENRQSIFHGYSTKDESIFYFGRNDRYERVNSKNGILVYKDDQLVLSTKFIFDKKYGSRINLEYSVSDPNLRFLKLLALETTLRNFENSPPVRFAGRTEEELDSERKSRYNN